jgi:peptidoglycan/LPS O-acetylase OafA/YrhL
LPVFVMGVLAGLLRVGPASGDAELPWPLLAPLPVCCTGRVPRSRWAFLTDVHAVGLLVLTVAASAVQSVFVHKDFGGEFWLQCAFPMAQLTIIHGLTMDNNSWSSIALRHPIAQWFGTRSMEIYLTHFLLIFYVCLALAGPIKWPDNLDCASVKNHAERDQCQRDLDAFNDKRLIPVWGVPVVMVAAVAIAHVLFTYVTDPCRKWFRADAVIISRGPVAAKVATPSV